jgi:preprotein translocase subunit SecE
MARIRPARGQGSSGDGNTPAPGGARAPKEKPKEKPKAATKPATRRQPPSPRPTPQKGGRRGNRDKAGSVTKAVVQQRRGSRFISEVIAELRKVSWPTRTQLMQSTAVVLVVVAIVAAYLAALDAVFSRMVDAIF